MTRRSKSQTLTPAELELMNVLWKHGPSSVQMVVARLPPGRDLAYTTVQTVLNTLQRKGKVRRVLRNRAFHYEPAVSHAKAAALALKELVKGMFGGSAERLVLSMVESRQLTREKLRELKRMVDQAESEGK